MSVQKSFAAVGGCPLRANSKGHNFTLSMVPDKGFEIENGRSDGKRNQGAWIRAGLEKL
jgi:hypothetical protein